MKETLHLIRSQSVVLVDLFAAAFLFIFVAFLMLYTMFLLSIDQIETKGTGGWKVFGGIPFTTEEVTAGLSLHAEQWADEAFVEFHADRIVTYARTYRQPDVFDMRNGADPEAHMRAFLRTVRRDHERLGPTAMSEAGYGNDDRPTVSMYVFDSRFYYEGRDLIQEYEFSWAEFAVPRSDGAPGLAGGDGDGDGGGSNSIDPERYSADWQNILSDLNRVRDQRAVPSEATSKVTPLQGAVLDEEEITILLLEAETDEDLIIDRLLPFLFLLVIVPVVAEGVPIYRKMRARWRLRAAFRSRSA
ncbi:MAG: hypothetical protein AAF636_27580 [Pseudomonadota bacterium]